SLAGLPVGGKLGPAIRRGLAGAGSGGGLGGLEHAAGHLVEGLGVSDVDLAGGARLVGAVGAHLGAVALVVGGDIGRGEDGDGVGVSQGDRVVAARSGVGGMVLGAFVDAGQVADQADGAVGAQPPRMTR